MNILNQRILLLSTLLSLLICWPKYSLSEPLKITFVGTGGPELSVERGGISTLLRIGDEHVLIDAGRNLMQNLYESGIDPRDVNNIVFTHLHNDHIEGLPTLWMTGWFLLGRQQKLTVWGPKGTQAMINGMRDMYQFDIEHRSDAFNDERLLEITVHEFSPEQVIFKTDNISITSIEAQHSDGNPAFSFFIETEQKDILITGDTRLYPELISYGKKADIIISNILAMPDELAQKPEMKTVIAKLMTINEAVELFSKTEPELAVYTHFVTKDIGGEVDSFIEKETRNQGYSGPLFLAKDGWSININDTITVAPAPKADELPNMDRKKHYKATP